MEYLMIMGKSLLFYLLIIAALRFMGKREIGELSVLDIVIYLVMSELLALAISEDADILQTIVPIATLSIAQFVVSYVLLKKEKLRDVLEGEPSVLIRNGVIDQKEMRKQRYTVDDLLYQLRDKEIATIEEVEYAILENSGTLSVLSKQKNKLRYPFPLIADGQVQKKALIEIGEDEAWLHEQIQNKGTMGFDEIFLALWQKNDLYLIKKQPQKTPEMK